MLIFKETPTQFRDFDLYSESEKEIEISETEILELFENVFNKKTEMDIVEIFVKFDKNCHGEIRFFDASIEEAQEKFPNSDVVSVVYYGNRVALVNFQDHEMYIS